MQDATRAYIAGFLDGDGSIVSNSEFLDCAKLVDAFATLNYSKRKHVDARCVERFLNSKGVLVPVTTEALVPRSPATARKSKSKVVITRQLPETG